MSVALLRIINISEHDHKLLTLVRKGRSIVCGEALARGPVPLGFVRYKVNLAGEYCGRHLEEFVVNLGWWLDGRGSRDVVYNSSRCFESPKTK